MHAAALRLIHHLKPYVNVSFITSAQATTAPPFCQLENDCGISLVTYEAAGGADIEDSDEKCCGRLFIPTGVICHTFI